MATEGGGGARTRGARDRRPRRHRRRPGSRSHHRPRQQVNLLWVVIGAVLVIFMQAGFALVETGFCRAKHAAHVVSTNFAIFGLGFVAFFLVGYALHVRRLHATPLVGFDDAAGRQRT